MFNCPCRLPIPREGRDILPAQIQAWAKAKGRTDIQINDDLWVTVDADPELCNALKEYFGSSDAWDGGLQDFLDFSERFKDMLSEEP